MFLLALPAGALADIIEPRRLLIAVEISLTVATAIFAALASLGSVTATTLIVFTLLIGAGAALIAPAWQAITPQLVPRQDLQSALALNSVGINISRAIGPALGGLIIAAPFWFDATSNMAVVAALLWWRSPPRPPSHLPAERLGHALRSGLRFARNILRFAQR